MGKRRQKRQWQSGATRENQLLLLASKTERGHEPKCWQPLEAGKDKEMDSSLELPEDTQPC